jgi:hypothetical protein
MSRLLYVVAIIVSSLVFSTAMAAETATGIAPTDTTSSPLPLFLDTVEVNTTQALSLGFNQSIRIESIRIRIIDQSTNESIKVSSITGSTMSPNIAVISTSTALVPGGAYVLTITSALSISDQTIKAGVDSIREFTAPMSIAPPVLNAPPNPTAVVAATGVTATPKVVVPANTGATVSPTEAKALPATGAPTILMFLLAGLLAYGITLLRKKA